MKQRSNPIERPNRKPYIVADCGEFGKITFRIPSPGTSMRLVRAYSEINQENLEEVERVCGELVKECWADGVYELTGKDGFAVYQELWEAGWTTGMVFGLVGALIEQINQAIVAEGDAEERVDFFGTTHGRSTSSISDASTSEIHGDSTVSPETSS